MIKKLVALQQAPNLRWHCFVVFEPGSGVDGRLYASDRELTITGVANAEPGISLDVYTPDEMTQDVVLPYGNGVGVALAPNLLTLGDVELAIKLWCRDNLGREDVVFDSWG